MAKVDRANYVLEKAEAYVDAPQFVYDSPPLLGRHPNPKRP